MSETIDIEQLEKAVAAIPESRRAEIAEASRAAVARMNAWLERLAADEQYRRVVYQEPSAELRSVGFHEIVERPEDADYLDNFFRRHIDNLDAGLVSDDCHTCLGLAIAAIGTVVVIGLVITLALVPEVYAALFEVSMFEGVLTLAMVVAAIGQLAVAAGHTVCREMKYCRKLP